MIKKSTGSLPKWSSSSASSGAYFAKVVVFYQKNSTSAGYAYKAKTPYAETSNPPNANPNWGIDESYSTPWSQSGDYKIGSRVYYHNGAKAYGYIASERYFGGNGKPNEEVDSDGVRTWELDIDYRYTYYASRKQFLYPVRKHGGFTGNKTVSMNPADPEERAYIPLSGGDKNLNAFIKSYKLYGADDYSDVNSVYCSNPYDKDVYNFYLFKRDAKNNLVHARKGVHMAKFTKDNSTDPKNKSDLNGKSQAYYVQVRSSGFYYNPHGFSIEMWPTISASDYELVASTGIYEFETGDSIGGADGTRPNYYITPEFSGFEGVISRNSFSFNGDIRNPDGIVSDSTPFELLKLEAIFSRNVPAFSERNATMFFIKTDIITYFEKIDLFYIDNDGNKVITGHYYNGERGKSSLSVIKELINSRQESYKSDTKINYVRTIVAIDYINLKKYITENTFTTLTFCGFRID